MFDKNGSGSAARLQTSGNFVINLKPLPLL